MMRLGLIGAGRWGRRYITTISEMPNAELRHLASGNPDSQNLVENQCIITSDWKEVATNPLLDGIIIASPPAWHFEMAMLAISSGLPVLVEKPMTVSLSQADKLVASAIASKTLLMVGHTHLFSAAYQMLKKLSKEMGKLEKIISIGGNWGPFRTDISMMWDYAPHDLAMCLDLYDAFPNKIEVLDTQQRISELAKGESVKINLEFSKGFAEIYVSNIEQKKQRSIEAHFEKGMLIYNDQDKEGKLKKQLKNGDRTLVTIDDSMPLTNVVSEFCEKILTKINFDSSLALGAKVIKVLEICQKKIALRKQADINLITKAGEY